MINRKSHVPLYVQLANILREQIRSGEITPGSKLPSEAEMIHQYNLGRLTIRDALAILSNEGLIEKQHGRGTFCKSNLLQSQYKIHVLLNLTDVYFIPYYLQSICNVLEKSDANVILCDTKNDATHIYNLLKKIVSEGSDGILIQPSPDATTPSEKMIQMFQRLIRAGIPYIMIDSSYTNVPQSYVVMDEFRAGTMAAEYFKSMGHKSLCMIALQGFADSEQRMKGFADALNIQPYRINYSQNLQQELATMLSVRGDITGIFCHNDEIAKKCYEILNRLSVSIPDRLSILSVDDTIIASTLSPPLTSIVHPKGFLGEDAASALISIISGETIWPYQKTFEPMLNIRSSCKNFSMLHPKNS